MPPAFATVQFSDLLSCNSADFAETTPCTAAVISEAVVTIPTPAASSRPVRSPRQFFRYFKASA